MCSLFVIYGFFPLIYMLPACYINNPPMPIQYNHITKYLVKICVKAKDFEIVAPLAYHTFAREH